MTFHQIPHHLGLDDLVSHGDQDVAADVPLPQDPGGALGRVPRPQRFGLVCEGDVGVDPGHRLHDVDGLLAHDQEEMLQSGGFEGVDDADDGGDSGDGETDLVVPGGAHAPTVSAAENDAGGLHLGWSCRRNPTKPERRLSTRRNAGAPSTGDSPGVTQGAPSTGDSPETAPLK